MDEQPTKRGPGRPATGQTPMRKLRAGAIWDEATALAKANGETTTSLVIRAIEREVARLKRQGSKES